MAYIFRLTLILLVSLALTPLYFLLGLLLLLTGALGRLWPLRRPTPAHPPLSTETASLIILNWNGKDLLAEGLPSVLRAVEYDGRPHEVIVVDNGSQDGSMEFVRERFPQVRLIALPKNLGFGEGNNAAIPQAKNDIVILLNNDMVLDDNFIRPLLDGFAPDVFAVTGQVYFQDRTRRREETGKTSGRFVRGQLVLMHEIITDCDPGRDYMPVLYAGGGSTAYDRRKLLALGGFDKVYSPAYVEDVDLSYRAWKEGWRSLFTPRSVVFHKHRSSSVKRFGRRGVDALYRRNHFIFFWKNITDAAMTFVYTLYFPWIMYHLLRDYGFLQLGAFFRALARLPLLLPDRWRAAARSGLATDRAVLTRTRERWRYFEPREEAPPVLRNGHRRPLNILMLTAYLPHSGFHAGGVRMFELIRHLSARHRITLVTFLETEAERPRLAEVAPYCADVQAVLRQPPPPLNLFPYEPYLEFRTYEMAEAVRYALEAHRYDLIHCEYAQMAQYLPEGTNAKRVLTNHEVGFTAHHRLYEHTAGALPRTRAFYNYLQVLNREVQACARADKIVCVSPEDAADLGRYMPPSRIAVATMGVDLDYFRPNESAEEEHSLIFVGGFRHYPNVDGMLFFHRSIWPRIRKQAPNARLYIVGSNPPEEILQLRREAHIMVTGQVPDLRPYLARAAVFVAPLRLGVGMRGKVLEAWAMRKPMVATRLACAGLAAVDGENLFIADDPDLFAERVVYLLHRPDERRRMGDNAGRAVQSYDWRRIADQVETVYYDTMEQSR